MKTIGISLTLFLLLTSTGLRAQQQARKNTESNSGKESSSSQNYARKATNSQTMGKGVPYNKDAEQQGRTGTAGKSSGTTSGSASGSQGGMKRTHKSGAKANASGKTG